MKARLDPYCGSQGPIRNQAGELVVAEGERLDDGKLLSMDWYVEGVQGKLPK